MKRRDLLIGQTGAVVGVVGGYVIFGSMVAFSGAIFGVVGASLVSVIDRGIRKLRERQGSP